MRVSKYRLKKELNIIILNLYNVKQNFQLFKKLKSGEYVEYISRQFPSMFNLILNSLINNCSMGLVKLVGDRAEDCITIYDIIRMYEENNELFVNKQFYYCKDVDTEKKHRLKFDLKSVKECIKKLQKDLKDNSKITKFLKQNRNKFLAHNDKILLFNKKAKIKDYDPKIKVTYEEVEKFIDLLLEDLNSLSSSLFGITYAFLYEENDEIEFLKEILKQGKVLN